ncbi:MAG: hypothetical protein ACI9FB_001369 [Candidatus Azotimanducaceae bacterium]|jgi:hypothetical protein
MMPIFFNVESHLWIAYLFFFNGLLINWLLRSCSTSYSELTKPIEAQVLAAFFISILINGALLYCLDILNLSFAKMRFILPILTAGLVLSSIYRSPRFAALQPLRFEFGLARLGIYAFVFIILFYNGGLIELLADSWWHMSLASKIASSSTLAIDFGHLNSSHQRYYPPLWHGNLALAHTISGESMVVLWNSFTAWGGVLKVMGFYLLALSLSHKKNIAILSAALFVLLPGLGDSYLRVSAWPSHIAYTALFAVFYVAFSILDSKKDPEKSAVIHLKRILFDLIDERAKILCVVMLLLVIFYSHQTELVWLTAAFLFYWIGVSVVGVFNASAAKQCEPAFNFTRAMGLALLLSVFLVSVWFAFNSWERATTNIDLMVSYCLPVVMLIILLYLQLGMLSQPTGFAAKIYSKPLAISLLVIVGLVLLCSIDSRHFVSLFDPDQAYPRGASHESFLVATGWFGGNLAIPGWHLQLRGGLLYSGIVSLPLSLYLAIIRPSRLTVFLAATGILAFLFCSSPYFYQWLKDVLNYHSPWRIGIIIFHPIVIATACYTAWHSFIETEGPRNA